MKTLFQTLYSRFRSNIHIPMKTGMKLRIDADFEYLSYKRTEPIVMNWGLQSLHLQVKINIRTVILPHNLTSVINQQRLTIVYNIQVLLSLRHYSIGYNRHKSLIKITETQRKCGKKSLLSLLLHQISGENKPFFDFYPAKIQEISTSRTLLPNCP